MKAKTKHGDMFRNIIRDTYNISKTTKFQLIYQP